MNLDAEYWEKRYRDESTPWDMGSVSPPIKQWLDNEPNKNLNILIPGAGNAHEVAYAYQLGFHQVHLLDFAETPLKEFKTKNPHFPSSQIIQSDFFKWHDTYDLIIEQTFFCALHPSQRNKYVEHTSNILKENGKLIGLLFDFPLTEEGPPFGGNLNLYESLFKPFFKNTSILPCLNSIPPRAGREFWIEMEK